MIRRYVLAAVVVGGVCLGPGLAAYLKLGTDVADRTVQLQWANQPVRYFITNRAVPGVGPNELRSALSHAFSTWGSVPTATLSSEFAGFTAAEPFSNDGVSVIGFSNRPDLESVLGSTTFVVDSTTGALLESDIFLNSAFQWSVAAGGESARYDVESIALHEVGHLLGLSHSALGETALGSRGGRSVVAKRAVMFPIAYPPSNIEDRTLEADDIAGISDIYGTQEFKRAFGSISGRVLLNDRGVYGAHVVAFNNTTGTLTGGFTLTAQGQFVIGGLPPGVYVVRAEPIDDADLESFFDPATIVDVDFRPAYAPSLVAVPAGGSGKTTVEIKVLPK